jgi:hypothetical protein
MACEHRPIGSPKALHVPHGFEGVRIHQSNVAGDVDEPLAEAVRPGSIRFVREDELAAAAMLRSAFEKQVGGDHYKKMKIQPMEFSMANGLDACQHTIIKYVTRFRDKNGVQDLEKAKHVIDMLIEFESAKS